MPFYRIYHVEERFGTDYATHHSDDKKNLEKYAQTGTPEYQRMVNEIARRLGLTSLKFATIEDLIESIGLPKERVCTHCFDGSSYNR